MKMILLLHAIVGVVLVVVGLYAGARPYALLDVVLTPTEIQNRETADATLQLLRRGAGADSWWMFGIGTALVVSSLIGLCRGRVSKDVLLAS
jgi:hypothetical protein